MGRSTAPRRILITGGAGFVGRHLLDTAARAWPQAELIAAARDEDVAAVALPPGVRHQVFTLEDHESIARAVREAAPDLCFHLAAAADVAASFADPDRVWALNAGGTRALAGAILREAPGCVLIHAGSAEIYGLSFQSGQPLDEAAPLRPANPYAAAKAAADLALGEMALRGLHVLRMRPLNHVGPGQSPRFALANFARQIARIASGRQAPVIRTGALDRARDVLDVRDVCAAYVLAAQRASELPAGACFNIASGTPRRMDAVLAAMLEMAGVTAAVETEAASLRPTDLLSTCADASAARAALGWAPGISWAQTLRDILDDWTAREAMGA